MRKLILCVVLFLITATVAADIFERTIDYKEALTGYKPIYFITGFGGPEQVKIQLSFKYDLFYPYKIGIYLAYSQLMFWDLYDESGPFREINYNPEFFWRFTSGDNFLGDLDILLLDYFQLGLDHLSNGEYPERSEGYTGLYAQLQLSYGSYLNCGLNYKYFWLFDFDEGNTADIQDYIGSMTTTVFLKLIDPEKGYDLEEIYFRFGFGGGVNGLDFAGGWQEVGLKSRTLFSRFRPFIHFYRGYAESLIEYDQTKEELGVPGGVALKVGLIVE